MSKQTINIGASPNDGTGTPLRTSFDYTNQNFTEIYTALGGGVALPGATTQVIFNDGGTNLAGDAGLVYNKTTDALTVAGLVTAGSATITGALGAAGLNVTGATIPANGVYLGSANNLSFSAASALGMTLNSTGLGIGASPVANFRLTSIGAFSSGNGGAYIETGEFNRYGLVVNNSNAGATTNLVEIRKASVALAAFTASGNLAFGNGLGIDFAATASGSGTMTSELLNDYEEGIFTAGVAFAGASVGVVYAQQIGIYTKVGRIVHFSGRVDLSNKGTSTGAATITGLPFNANIGAASVGYQLSAAPSGEQVMLTISSTILTIRYATGITTALSTDADFANNSIIIFGGTYAV